MVFGQTPTGQSVWHRFSRRGISELAPSSVPRIVQILAIALAYFLLARLGQVLAIEPGNVTPVWPASGLALVVVLKRGYWVWPGLWLGNFLGNAWAFLDTTSLFDFARTMTTGILIGPGDIAQACVGAYLLRRYCMDCESLGRIRDVIVFVVTQAVACLFSATFGVLALCLGGEVAWTEYAYTWLTWFFGDGVGIILVAPLLLHLGSIAGLSTDRRALAEAGAIWLSSAVCAALVFSDTFEASLSFLPLPIVLWAAVRGNQFIVSVTVLVIAAIATWGTSEHRGPFASGDINVSLIVLQLYVAITAITGALIVAALGERSRTEKQLGRTGERLSEALRGANVGLWDWDVPTSSVYYSPQFKLQLGYGPDVRWNSYEEWESRLHPDDKERAVELVRRYLDRDTNAYVSRFRLRRKDGNYVWILSRGQAVWNRNGEPLRMIGVHVDVTESMLRERELERANRELQQMAYATTHDLQEPLRSITSYTQLLERRYEDCLGDEERSWLQSIVGGTRRMKALLQDLRVYSQVDTPIRGRQPVCLDAALQQALVNLELPIESSQARIVHESLPTILGVEDQIVQLFEQLIVNAIQYRSKNPLRIHISAEHTDDAVTLKIRDNGVGIEAEQHEAIFEVFRRLHHQVEQSGTGIGLAICRRIVHRHHGEIWVESSPGEGSTFFCLFPCKRESTS